MNVALSFLKRKIEKLKCCANCGYYFVKQDALLCKSCEELVEFASAQTKFKREFREQTFEGICLWNWFPWENDALSALLASIKGGDAAAVLKKYSNQLILKRGIKEQSLNQKCVVVPAPASRQNTRDHAYVLAEEVSRLLEYRFENCFIKLTSEKQRLHGKQERGHLKVKFYENISKNILTADHIIFVDDIVTTGATISAMIKAFRGQGFRLSQGNSKNNKDGFCKTFEVLCLAQRETCPSKGYLI